MSVSSVNGATLNVSNDGVLLGASGVDVGGTLYDVVFADGSCIQIFSGCDTISDLDFSDQASATDAAQALLDQVFVDTVEGAYDSGLAPIFGCGNTSICNTFIPFNLVSVFGAPIFNYASSNNTRLESNDSITIEAISGQLTFTDHSFRDDNNFALFTTASPVPVPAAVWLFGTALIGLVGFGKRKSKVVV